MSVKVVDLAMLVVTYDAKSDLAISMKDSGTIQLQNSYEKLTYVGNTDKGVTFLIEKYG